MHQSAVLSRVNPKSLRKSADSFLGRSAALTPEMGGVRFLPRWLTMELWSWGVLGAVGVLAAYQQFRIYRIARESAKREELFEIVTENAADMIALVDVKGRRLYNSPAYKRILGYSPAELEETSAFEQIHPDDRFKVLEAGREARRTGIGQKLEYRIRHRDGTWRVLESNANTIRNDQAEVVKLVIVNRDVTERKRAQEQLEHNTFHDALTGLPNRRLFLDRLERLFVRAGRDPECLYAILFVDLDGFKGVNDRIGSAAADRVIIQMGQRVVACLRQTDTVARHGEDLSIADAMLSRFGGDEFTLLLDEVGDPSDAMRVARRIQVAAAEPFLFEHREVRISASIGIALNTTAHLRAEDLLLDADVAMRRAKAMGGSRCEVFDEAMHTRAVNRLRLEADLRTAIAQHQFRVFYQPVVRLQTKRIMGFEALLRWQHPEQGLVSPYKFIEAAEDTGLLISIGHWLLKEACRQWSAWQVKGPSMEPVSMMVNLSAKQFADARLVAQIQGAVRETGIDPSRLQLEITEDVAAADHKLTVTLLAQLKHVGFGVILDDFGTGHSSLKELREFPVDALKIDRSLVGEMLADRSASDVVELIITLAHKRGLRVIAEGIESAKHVDRLGDLGCELGQGSYFSQPVAAEAAEELLFAGRPRAGGAGAT